MNGLALGIDPGLDTTGWGLLTIDSPARVQSAGSFKSDPTTDDDVRTAKMVRSVAELIQRTQPRVICIERYSYQGQRSHTENSFRVSRVAGAIEALALCHGAVVLLERNRILSLIGAKRDATKANVKALLRARFGHDVGSNEHARDGVAVGVAGLLVWRQQQLRGTGT